MNTFDNNYRFKAGGSITADAGGSTGAGGYTTETRYVEIKRLTGGDCKLSIFTSDAYNTSVLEGSKTLTPTGTITSALRYLGVKSGNSGTGNGTVVLTIDDISCIINCGPSVLKKINFDTIFDYLMVDSYSHNPIGKQFVNIIDSHGIRDDYLKKILYNVNLIGLFQELLK